MWYSRCSALALQTRVSGLAHWRIVWEGKMCGMKTEFWCASALGRMSREDLEAVGNLGREALGTAVN